MTRFPARSVRQFRHSGATGRWWTVAAVVLVVLVGVVGLRPDGSSQVPSGLHWVERLRAADSVAAMPFETVEQLQLMPRVAASGRIAEVDWEPARCGSN